MSNQFEELTELNFIAEEIEKKVKNIDNEMYSKFNEYFTPFFDNPDKEEKNLSKSNLEVVINAFEKRAIKFIRNNVGTDKIPYVIRKNNWKSFTQSQKLQTVSEYQKILEPEEDKYFQICPGLEIDIFSILNNIKKKTDEFRNETNQIKNEYLYDLNEINIERRKIVNQYVKENLENLKNYVLIDFENDDKNKQKKKLAWLIGLVDDEVFLTSGDYFALSHTDTKNNIYIDKENGNCIFPGKLDESGKKTLNKHGIKYETSFKRVNFSLDNLSKIVEEYRNSTSTNLYELETFL